MKADDQFITVSIETAYCEVYMSIAEVWPNGDAPDVITAEAVKEAMEKSGSKATVLRDWELFDADDLDVTVSVPNPEYTQDTALLPDLAPPRHLHAKVWRS